jgi:hypothetical protein
MDAFFIPDPAKNLTLEHLTTYYFWVTKTLSSMSNKKATSKKMRRKEARQKIYNALVIALAEFRTGAKDKKFERNLRRTSRLFASEFIKNAKKDTRKLEPMTTTGEDPSRLLDK